MRRNRPAPLKERSGKVPRAVLPPAASTRTSARTSAKSCDPTQPGAGSEGARQRSRSPGSHESAAARICRFTRFTRFTRFRRGPAVIPTFWAGSLGRFSGPVLWAGSLGRLSGPVLWAGSVGRFCGRIPRLRRQRVPPAGAASLRCRRARFCRRNDSGCRERGAGGVPPPPEAGRAVLPVEQRPPPPSTGTPPGAGTRPGRGPAGAPHPGPARRGSTPLPGGLPTAGMFFEMSMSYRSRGGAAPRDDKRLT